MKNNLPLPPQFETLKIFVTPHISRKQLIQALDNIVIGNIVEDDILIIIADGIFGSAKQGLVLTRDYFYYKAAWENAVIGKIEDCKHVSYKEGIISHDLILEHKEIEEEPWILNFTQCSKKDIRLLANYFNKVVQLLNPEVLEENSSIENEENFSPNEIDKSKGVFWSNNTTKALVANNSSLNFRFKNSKLKYKEVESRYLGVRIDDNTPEPYYLGESNSSDTNEEITLGEENSILAKFINDNSDGILSKLKTSGLALTSTALQNDENILRIAGFIYNILPGPVRFVVSVSTIENLLLNNRQWLINKLQ